jgi:aryl-alcohol dehydrogenase-like predicted oxidoreductase
MDPRHRRALGRSHVMVDQLMLGLVPLGNLYKVVSDQEAEHVLQAWWDRGLRTFDVAPVYGFGIAEERLGRFLRGRPRDQFVVSTKVGRPVRHGAPDDPELYWPDGTPYFHDTPEGVRPYYDYTRDGMLWGLEQSLRRLGLDRVDYVHMHDPDDHIREAIDVVFPTLAELRASGVIGAIGVGTNWGRVGLPIAEACDIDCVLLAGRYTLVDHEGLEGLLPRCTERGIAVIAGGVFNGGFLADPRIGATFQYRPTEDQALVDRALRIKHACERHGVPIKAAALQFPMGHPAVVSVVVGAGSVEHVAEVVSGFELEIPGALWTELVDEGLLPREAPIPGSSGHPTRADG